MGRWVRFILAILLGIGLGVAYGWLISPVQYVDTSPDTLRIDYQADYVLMVAEAYQHEQDLPVAVRRLALLGNPAPADQVSQAIRFAQTNGYQDQDIQRLQDLLGALQAFNLDQGTTSP
jgi:hypothetical protein